MNRLHDRVAVVTGAGSGMGRAVASRLAAEGAVVVVVDRLRDAAEETVRDIVANGGAASAEAVDASDVSAIRALFERVDERYGVLHVLHSHVGMPGPAGLDITEDEWRQSIDINMRSAFFACSAAMPLLRKAQGKASVIFTASTSAIIGSPFSPLYSMTKGSLTSFVRSVALIGAPDGIRANVICPGPVDTPMLPQFFGREAGADVADLVQSAIGLVPMGRAGTTAEIAGAVAFLASDDAGYITGVTLPIDGGRTIR